jgi:glycosyltransferase involved in cell wall biosynthesis
MEKTLKIISFNTTDETGGAARCSWNLFKAGQSYGHSSKLVVGYKHSADPDVILMPNIVAYAPWGRFWHRLADIMLPFSHKIPGCGILRRGMQCIGNFRHLVSFLKGYEDYNFPGIWNIFTQLGGYPDIIHCHNLHGDYFDLRALPWLSKLAPTIITLHDSWLLGGHCGHPFDCERWMVGCGRCPDINIVPKITRDASAYNWRLKQKLYAQAKVFVAASSRWLLEKARRSILRLAIVEDRVIPYGVDLTIFSPGDKGAARVSLGMPRDAIIVLSVADRIKGNIWKDYELLRKVIKILSARHYDKNIIFIVLGENASVEKFRSVEVRFIPYIYDRRIVAKYYCSSDVYLHPAKIDTFPNAVLEAMACGIPVIATAVGGIPEQISDGITGFLVPKADVHSFIGKIEQLFLNSDLLRQLGHEAAIKAREKFDLTKQTGVYLKWYQDIIDNYRQAS